MNAIPIFWGGNGQLPVQLNAGSSSAGACWYFQQLFMDAFIVQFTFNITKPSGTSFGDGMTWAVTNDPRLSATTRNVVGGTGGSLGLEGLYPAVAFRFDTYNGGPQNTAGVIYTQGPSGQTAIDYSDGGEFKTHGILNWPSGNNFVATVYYTQVRVLRCVVASSEQLVHLPR